MRLLGTGLVLVCALALAPAAHAGGLRRPPVSWLKGEGNYTKSHRSPTSIDCIVVHVTEGAFWGSVSWLRNHHSHASSHYVVSRRGRIVQLVHQSDIAWHASNWRVNAESVGIEHEGITDSPTGFTDAQYRASAKLAAYIARTALMPIDRRHLIGHDEVPDPSDPGKLGGSSHHTDPGRYWSWPRYVRLVRSYAYLPKPKPRVRLLVESATVYRGQVVAGTVPWRARVGGPVTRVDFLVDRKLRWRDRRAPFAFAGGRGWTTTGLANGRHTLELRAYGRRGAWTRKRLVVRVSNVPLVLRATLPAGELAGAVPVRASVKAPRVELFVDGRRVDHDTSLPFAFAWDSGRVANGPHVLELRAKTKNGRVARKRLPVVVANPQIGAQSLSEGQTVSGPVEWRLETRGRVERVELVVDGAARATLTSAPYAWVWDTSGEAPGAHSLTARAFGPNGSVAEASLAVVVG